MFKDIEYLIKNPVKSYLNYRPQTIVVEEGKKGIEILDAVDVELTDIEKVYKLHNSTYIKVPIENIRTLVKGIDPKELDEWLLERKVPTEFYIVGDPNNIVSLQTLYPDKTIFLLNEGFIIINTVKQTAEVITEESYSVLTNKISC